MNFTSSHSWINSLYIRYPLDEIINIGNIYFYKKDNILKCQNFFEIDNYNLNELNNYLNDYKLRFSYIDDSKFFEELKKWSFDNNLNFEIIDSWDAPILETNDDIEELFINNKHEQIRRDYKKYLKNKSNYLIKKSNKSNILELWKDVLTIDFNSWKKEEKSDMKSLDREDLQYYPYMNENKNNISLEVLYDKKKNPLAYSLMFKSNNKWYAAKWGASFDGRKDNTGFYILFNHLINLYNIEKKLYLDFWGRRNNTYDYLKNKEIRRHHIMISKKEK